MIFFIAEESLLYSIIFAHIDIAALYVEKMRFQSAADSHSFHTNESSKVAR